MKQFVAGVVVGVVAIGGFAAAGSSSTVVVRENAGRVDFYENGDPVGGLIGADLTDETDGKVGPALGVNAGGLDDGVWFGENAVYSELPFDLQGHSVKGVSTLKVGRAKLFVKGDRLMVKFPGEKARPID